MPDITITEGNTLEIDYEITNTGNSAGNQDVRLEIADVLEDTDANVQLDAGATTTGTLEWPTESGDAVTDALAEAVTDDTRDSITVTVESAIPDSGVSRWGFEQNVTDSWGDNDAVNNGATFTTNSEVGDYELDFDGVDDYVEVGEIGIEGLQEFTLSAWVFSRDPNNTNTQNIMVNGSSSNNDTFDFSVKSGQVRVNLNSFSTNISGGNLTSDTWTMATFTYDDNSGQSNLYFDGSEVASGGSSGALNSTPATFKFGGRGDDLFIDGLLDDARFYSKALSETEVSNLYNTGSISG